MSDEAKERLETCWEWVQKAEGDLTNAAHTLGLGQKCPTETVCFHAQQCVEKYVKGLLTWLGRGFPKTHDLRIVIRLLPPKARPVLTKDEQNQLSQYASIIRYPGDPRSISLAEARMAVAVARRVRRDIRRQLPRRAIRRQEPGRPT